ncbi:MexH family multidrug efflux RND transporter periplasmic adaptor subunit [Thalassotalea marina]|uniref:MexH family multidrug efflux RND transporter periplasmic adaptor subunit n=2 Tax=Thalassotalea marina TaxID=1673741 RepID=A0A919BQ98_9GAMM|nr:MexH family multidrug efflux RND transporter periplasmic adaptor subunit [Thalassotalea marina]
MNIQNLVNIYSGVQLLGRVLFSILLCGYIAISMPAFAANVVVEEVSLERTKQQVKVVGNAEAIHSVTLFPAVGDRVVAVHFKPGNYVNKGDLLVELDSRRQRAASDKAKITLKDAQRKVSRLTESQARGAVPQSDLDDAKTLLELAKVALTQAQTELEDRRVIAPFSGVMGLTDVEVGDRITTQTAIATIDDVSKLYINFNAPESVVNLLKQQGKVDVVAWQGEQTFQADITYLDSRIDRQTRTLRAKATLDNAQQSFMPGMSFRVYMNVLGEPFAVVPEAALMWGATGPYIWKSVDKKATRVDVKIEQRLAGRLLVSGSVQEGDVLITEGVQRLRPGQALNFVNQVATAKD